MLVSRKIERDKGSKYYINGKEVRARDAQTFFADLSTGAHSPSMISQGKIGQLVISKPVERRAILEEAAGIAGIHARRHEAETRLNAAENNLKRADELKRQQEKQLDNLKKQAEEATKYKEISKKIRKAESGLYYLKLKEIEKNKKEIIENISEQDDEISALKIDMNHNNTLLEEENKKLSPLRDKKIENLAKLQKLNLDMVKLEEEEERVKTLNAKLKNSIDTIVADLDRERSIALDASVNEKRILQEKNELIKTEKVLSSSEIQSDENRKRSLEILNNLKTELNKSIDQIEDLIDNDNKISKDVFKNLKSIINKITRAQEEYALASAKNEVVKNDSFKRKERIKNIDLELENWKNLKTNSEKMTIELDNRKNKILKEFDDNQKNPEKIATSKGQNIQNLENTKKINKELEDELIQSENKFNSINSNIKLIQENLSNLREKKRETKQQLMESKVEKKIYFIQ